MPSGNHTTNFEVLEELGQGAFGKVFKIKRHSDGEILAMKKIYLGKMSARQRADVEEEARVHCSLDHPYIVRLDSYEVDEENDNMHIFMELCGGGDLDTYIEKRRESNARIPEPQIWSTFFQLVDALDYCHNAERRADDDYPLPLMHRDLKPANIFMNSDHSEIRLGDFGLAKQVNDDGEAKSICGTCEYYAPELHKGQPYLLAVDIYALGAILFEMCTLNYLVEGIDSTDVKRKVLAQEVDYTIPRQYSIELARLVKCLLSYDDSDRPSTKKILAMPGVQWGRTQVEWNDERAAFKVREKSLKEDRREARDRARRLEDKVREMEAELAKLRKVNNTRSVALDAREAALNGREAAVQTEISKRNAEYKKDLEARERQLLRDRLAFEQLRSQRRRGYEARGHSQDASAHSSQNETDGSASAVSRILVARGNVTSSFSSGAYSSDRALSASSLGSASVVEAIAQVFGSSERDVGSSARGIRRVPKENNLRALHTVVNDVKKSIAEHEVGPTSETIPASPQRKLRSEGDLRTAALGTSARSNIPIAISRQPGGLKKDSAVATKQQQGTKKSPVAKPNQRLGQTRSDAAASQIPRYNLRSAANKVNMALALRCA